METSAAELATETGETWSDCYWQSADGLKLHYRDYAGRDDRPPILCLHGLTRNARDFEGVAGRLAGDWRVIVPEMRGRGRSEYAADPMSYNPMVYVGDVLKLLDELEITSFISIGTSMGGLMTMMLAMARPGLIAGAVINDIGPVIDTSGIARIGGYVGKPSKFSDWDQAARAISQVHGAAFPDWDHDQWVASAKQSLVPDENGLLVSDYDMAIAEPFKQPGNAAPPDLWPAWDALGEVPVTLVRGALTDLLSEQTVAEMQRRLPQLNVVMVPRVGHAPTLEEPPAAAAIDNLLAQLA